MSEVVQITVDWSLGGGSGILILLFIRAKFARVIGFVAIVLGIFMLSCVVGAADGVFAAC